MPGPPTAQCPGCSQQQRTPPPHPKVLDALAALARIRADIESNPSAMAAMNKMRTIKHTLDIVLTELPPDVRRQVEAAV